MSKDIPVPDLSGSKHPGGVPMVTHKIGVKYDLYVYRKRWLELHKQADVIQVDEKSGLPTYAMYKFWASDEPDDNFPLPTDSKDKGNT